MTPEDGGDAWLGLDLFQHGVEREPMLLEMRPCPRPARYRRCEELKRPRHRRIEHRAELVGEEVPVHVQPRLCTVANALGGRLVAVSAKALWVIDDADRRVAIRRDEHEPTNRL